MINNQLDDTDRRILNLLQSDSRISYKEIAHKVHKSVTAVHVRVKRLLDDGYIKSFTVIVDNKKIGRGLTGFVEVSLEKHTEKSLLDFMQEVVKLDEVMACYHLTGAYDFLLRVAINDMAEYSQVLLKKLSNLPGIENFTSHFVMNEVKQVTSYPIIKGV
ncbi:Lrp/AsnC family transcriptional regulator [Mucilaginibacter sp.]|uniref:Lrp/AsnC family transcriptional regulator n=1 Tax=Mucilaginibacter sp. TaxID=1882438 RepID=UPI003D0CCDCE